jgi:hypothetical protein
MWLSLFALATAAAIGLSVAAIVMQHSPRRSYLS